MTEPAAGPLGSWSRLHPLSPLLRSGRFVLAAVALVGQQGLRDASLRVLLLGVAVVVPLGLLVGLVSWLTTRYRLTATELQVESGLLQRRSRRVPLARLQSVDVVRSLAARVLGLAELRLEVAGGGRTEAPLAHLAEADAVRLRAELLAASRSEPVQVADGPAAAAGEGTVLVRVPTGALVLSTLLTLPALLTALMGLAVLVLLAVRPAAAAAVVAALLPTGLGTGGFAVRRVLAEYGFTVAEGADGLRLHHGLLDTRQQVIPAGRVQTVRVEEPLLWRWRGWVRVEVDVAGYAHRRGTGEESSRTSALLPVAPRAFALALVERVLGAPLPTPLVAAPARARWRAPLSARRLAVAVDDVHVVTTAGVLTRTTDVVPLRKVQGLQLVQGPWQRRLRLATVRASSAGKLLRGATASHRDAGEAAELLEDLVARARRARRRVEPH